MAKFCTNCGSELPENAAICVNCGNMIGDSGNNKKEKRKGLPVWAIVLIVVGCIILIPIIILVVFAIGCFNYIQDNDINIEDYVDEIISVKGTIGDTLTDDDIKITLTDAIIYDTVGSDDNMLTANEENEYLVFFFNILNVSDESRYISTYNFSGKVDGISTNYKAFDGEIDGVKELAKDLNNNEKTTGYIVYEVPKTWKSFVISYKENSFDRESISFTVVNEDNNDSL